MLENGAGFKLTPDRFNSLGTPIHASRRILQWGAEDSTVLGYDSVLWVINHIPIF
jgi:hypothetical protein